MKKIKLLPLLVGLGLLVLLGGSVSYAVARATGGGWSPRSMMNGGGYSMMGGAAGTRSDWYLQGSGPVSDIAAARAQAQRFADRLDLKTGEVMQFTSNFYVLLEDSQGKPATEVLVDPQTGDVTLEYGPAMMWNTRYGMMGSAGATTMSGGGMMGGGSYGGMGGSGGMMGAGGMMGRYGGNPDWTPPSGSLSGPLTIAQAQQAADEWLAGQGSNQTAAQPDALPSYFTFHVLEGGKISGMLSVNQQTGAVWYHWWHGRFVTMEE